MVNIFLRTTFIFVLMLILVGCIAQVSLLNVYTVGKQLSDLGFGFTVNYPSNWKIVESPIAQKDYTSIKQLTQKPNYWIPFVKIFAPNNEAVVDVSAWGGKPWDIQEVEETARPASVFVVEQKRIIVSGYNAVYTHSKSSLNEESVNIDVIVNDKLFTISYKTSSDLFEKHKDKGLSILQSLKIR